LHLPNKSDKLIKILKKEQSVMDKFIVISIMDNDANKSANSADAGNTGLVLFAFYIL